MELKMHGIMSKRIGLHYGAMAFYTAVLHNLFLLYHVDIFVSIYKIDKFSFWISEVIFLVWNSVNDPLFGWISDRKYLSKGNRNDSDVITTRLKALSWNGPLFALSFLAFWVSWTFPSLQFLICLCAYDGFLTMIDLHHTALLADLSISADIRTELNMYCSLFSAFGSLSVFLSHVVWSHNFLLPFQLFCIVLALIAILGFLVSSRTLENIYRQSEIENHSSRHKHENNAIELVDEKAAVKTFIKELSGHRNFIWFTAMNLIQVFHCHFNSNFFPLFLEVLIGDSVPPVVCSLLLGVSFVAPHINNLYFLSLCRRYGAYQVIRLLFWIKLISSGIMLFMNTGHIWILCFFIASNRVFTEGTCKLLNLVISDLVDEDVVLHNRSQAVSALMFGTVAFLSKPGQTLAPLFGTLLLAIYTGHDVFESGNETGSLQMDAKGMTNDMRTAYRMGIYHLLVYVAIVCALIQLVFWSRFNLHGKRLDVVKRLRNGFKYSVV